MPRLRKRARLQREQLTNAQFWDLLLSVKWYADSWDRQAFETPAARRRAWEEHRERLLADVGEDNRPGAWWEYEAPGPKLEGESDTEALVRLGVASPACVEMFKRMFENDREGLEIRAKYYGYRIDLDRQMALYQRVAGG